jgi:hypothetical protein
MTPPPTGFPEAVIGYAAMRPGFAVRVCSYHPSGVREAEKWAEPLPVTHGCCEACYQRTLRAMMGEKP